MCRRIRRICRSRRVGLLHPTMRPGLSPGQARSEPHPPQGEGEPWRHSPPWCNGSETKSAAARRDVMKILCVLYPDPVDGVPGTYPRDDLPRLDVYPDGQTLPTPEAIDFRPGDLLGCVSG